ncbi:class I SAM-dependent methyltransferase [archaeon]|nr:class I SAM-dependent methyltransferase [archaeon]
MFTGKIYSGWMEDSQGEKIKEILKNVRPQKRVLDIGCGPGFLENFISDSFMVDTDLENLKKAKGEGNKVLADGSHLPFKDKSFKTIFCIDTIHLLDTEKIKEEIKRVLRGGTAVITAFCNEYNKSEKMSKLREPFEDFNIEREFFAGKREMDAVIVVRNN